MILEKSNNDYSVTLFDNRTSVNIPDGTYDGVIVDIKDRLNVERIGYNGTKECVNLTDFLFELSDANGNTYTISSLSMRVSLHEKSKLFKFLTELTGKNPVSGWDYMELKGSKCRVTVEKKTSRYGKKYSKIVNVSPFIEKMDMFSSFNNNHDDMFNLD
jgi:hypothetical protein